MCNDIDENFERVFLLRSADDEMDLTQGGERVGRNQELSARREGLGVEVSSTIERSV